MLSFFELSYLMAEVTSNRVGNVFTDGDPIRFRIRASSDTLIKVANYEGETIYQDVLREGEREIDLGSLPRGHYILYAKDMEGTMQTYFGVVPSQDVRPRVDDSCIASDVAMSWLVEPEKFSDLAYLTRLAGITWVRDRISWGEMETERGKWSENNRYDLSAEIQSKQGLKVYQVFHATPHWAQIEHDPLSFPDDLRDAYRFASAMAERFKGKVKAWEVWNEPDISVFSKELGDSYSALLKAMYLGFKSVDPELPVLICSFAMEPGSFAETIFQNDVARYFDIYNYHVYDDWRKHIDRAQKHLNLLKRFGISSKPIWLTEAGIPIRREEELLEFNESQNREVAEFLPKAIVSSLSAGIDKYFWFILPYYRERNYYLYGLLRSDLSVTAGYCSLSACTYALGSAKYLGKLQREGVIAHVFDRGDDKITIAFWAEEDVCPFDIQTTSKNSKLVNLMGVEQDLHSDSGRFELEAHRSVSYLVIPKGSLHEGICALYPVEKPLSSYDPNALSHVVMRLHFPRESRVKETDTYMLDKDKETKIGVEICNFGKDDFLGKLEMTVPVGWSAIIDESEVDLKPMERIMRQVFLNCTARNNTSRNQLKISLMNQRGNIETFVISNIDCRSDDK